MHKSDGIVDIRFRNVTAKRLLKSSSGYFTFEVLDGEALVSSYVGRVRSNRFETNIIQSKVITDILITLVEIDDANNHILTRLIRRGDRRSAMPIVIFKVFQVYLIA